MWAARPHLGSIFVKLLHRKTFWFVQRLSENHAIRKNGLPHPAKGGSTPCFCLPAYCNCPVALSEFVTSFIEIIKLRISKFQKMQLQLEKQTAKFNLLRKRGLLAHTSAAFLKNCCTEKFFSCLRFDSYNRLFLNIRQVCNLHQHICHQNCRICIIQMTACVTICIQSSCN